jgi:23S rRNA (pseudouridine1915-N3)-methyltransferase
VKLRLFCIGKLSTSFIKTGVHEYLSRIRRYIQVDLIEIKEGKASSVKKPSALAIADEGNGLLHKIAADAYAVVLDERGKGMGSRRLAGFLDRHMLEGTGELVFIIGGPYGLSDKVRERADLLLSLSDMTLPHQLARLVLLEQLYRAFTIIRNEPYHNG